MPHCEDLESGVIYTCGLGRGDLKRRIFIGRTAPQIGQRIEYAPAAHAFVPLRGPREFLDLHTRVQRTRELYITKAITPRMRMIPPPLHPPADGGFTFVIVHRAREGQTGKQ